MEDPINLDLNQNFFQQLNLFFLKLISYYILKLISIKYPFL